MLLRHNGHFKVNDVEFAQDSMQLVWNVWLQFVLKIEQVLYIFSKHMEQ